jgi:hypothetical protein
MKKQKYVCFAIFMLIELFFSIFLQSQLTNGPPNTSNESSTVNISKTEAVTASTSLLTSKNIVHSQTPIIQTPHKIVSKVFETEERNLKTSLNMHPVDIKSKLPNPKIVNLIRPQTSFHDHKYMLMKNAKNSELGLGGVFRANNLPGPNDPRLYRSKSAFLTTNDVNRSVLNASYLTTNRSKTPVTSRASNKRNELAQSAAELLDSKLASHDNLNLMTFKEIDSIIEKISGYFGDGDSKAANNPKDPKQDVYKKMWVLKSTGQYHGSLLLRPKAVAPEIRE